MSLIRRLLDVANDFRKTYLTGDRDIANEPPCSIFSRALIHPKTGVVVARINDAGELVGSGVGSTLRVKDFGAIGDGSTDDTGAIQSALDALAADTRIDTLDFGTGTYRLSKNTALTGARTGANRILSLTDDLAGRDIHIVGQGAVLYNNIATTRTHTLFMRGTFRSLTVSGLIFERHSGLLAASVGAEPSQCAGIAIEAEDDRIINRVSVSGCQFINAHPAMYVYGLGRDYWGKLNDFSFTGNLVTNLLGSCTTNPATAYGGGQQLLTESWVEVARIANNTFICGPETFATASMCKDGSFFGDAHRVIFEGNAVLRAGVEGFFHFNKRAIIGTTSAGFTMPASGATVSVVVGANIVTTFEVGEFVVIETAGRFEVTAWNAGTRSLTIENTGAGGNAAGGASIATDQLIYEPTGASGRSIVRGNLFDLLPPVGHETGGTGNVWGPAVALGDTQGEISGNTILNCAGGVSLYGNDTVPGVDGSADSIIRDNRIETLDSIEYPDDMIYGIFTESARTDILGNVVIQPQSENFAGIYIHSANARVDDNRVRCGGTPSKGAAASDRARGIYVINSGSARCRNNRTENVDVGVGPDPGGTNVIIVHGHSDSGSTLPVNTSESGVRKGKIACHVELSATTDQNVASGATSKIVFNDVRENKSALWNTTDKRVVAPRAGRIRVDAFLYFGSLPDGENARLRFYKNGSAYQVGASLNGSGSTVVGISGFVEEACAAGDYYEVYLQNASASGVDVFQADSKLVASFTDENEA